MKHFTIKLLFLASSASILSAHEGPWTAGRPDGHAPITVMGDHMHAAGEWMLSYRYMTMDMENLVKGSDTTSTVAAGYNMLPAEMTMDMHMFGAMHAISDKWTLMGMFNYLDNDMDMKMGMMTSSVESSGLGDLRFSGLYDLASWNNGRRVHLNVGISAPTGSIDEKSAGDILGYGMQLGSGTWDFLPAITLLGQTDNYSWGTQLGGTIRMGDNDRDYSLGNRFDAVVWGARKLSDSFSLSAKFDYFSQDEIDGLDAEIDARRTAMMDSPGFDPASCGRDLSTFGLGLNYYCRNGTLKGHRLALEWETPMSEDVNGVQLETDSIWSFGWQYAW